MTPILLTSHEGTLSFRPPDDACAEAMRQALSFQHKFTAFEPTTRWDSKLAMMVSSGRPKRAFKTRQEALYAEEPHDGGGNDADSVITTHNGMLGRVTKTLESLGHTHAYERVGRPWPQAQIVPAVFRGLDAKQRETVVRLLLSVGGGLGAGATGYGKTRVIAALVRAYLEFIRSHPNQGVVIFTHAQSVVRSLHRELNELLAEDGVEVGICMSGQKDLRTVTVSTIQSSDQFDPDRIGVVIVDEVHGTTGDNFSARMLTFVHAARYGVSGSLNKRFDGKEAYLEACYGPVVDRVTDQETEASGRTCPQHVYFLHIPRGPEVEGLRDTALKRHGFWRNTARNQLFADAVARAPEDQQVLLFVETLEHLEWMLNNHLRGMGFEVCHGELKADERAEIERQFTFGEVKRLIATDCLSTGVDPKNLRIVGDLTGVQGDARMYQRRGRNRRQAPGKRFGVLLQADDAWSPKLARKAQRRRKVYVEHGDTVFDDATPVSVVYDVAGPDEETIDRDVEQSVKSDLTDPKNIVASRTVPNDSIA